MKAKKARPPPPRRPAAAPPPYSETPQTIVQQPMAQQQPLQYLHHQQQPQQQRQQVPQAAASSAAGSSGMQQSLHQQQQQQQLQATNLFICTSDCIILQPLFVPRKISLYGYTNVIWLWLMSNVCNKSCVLFSCRWLVFSGQCHALELPAFCVCSFHVQAHLAAIYSLGHNHLRTVEDTVFSKSCLFVHERQG